VDTQVFGLSAPLQIRVDTPTFNFRLDKSTLVVDRAQMEIDAITESSDTLITIEAKIGVPTTFKYVRYTFLFGHFFQRRKRLEISFFVSNH
jgi:hypothetical protein